MVTARILSVGGNWLSKIEIKRTRRMKCTWCLRLPWLFLRQKEREDEEEGTKGKPEKVYDKPCVSDLSGS